MSLVTEVMSLEKDKEHLRINLDRAEQEVRIADIFLLLLVYFQFLDYKV